MNRKYAFFDLHPVVSLVYFLCVIVSGMFFRNIVLEIISLIGAFVYITAIFDRRRVIRTALFCAAIIILMALTNPLFSHNGVTPLFYMNSMAVTVESVYYGVSSGIMLSAVLVWCAVFSDGFDFEKISYIFGRAFGNISVVISVALRLIKLIRVRSRDLAMVDSANGRTKLKDMLNRFSAIMDWSFEQGIELSHSMKARGYGRGRRSYYNRFHFGMMDAAVLIVVVILSGVTIWMYAVGDFGFAIYPKVWINITDRTYLGFILYSLLVLLPTAVQIRDSILWKYYRSGI